MSQQKLGRPKKEQTKPLIFERIRSRVSRHLTMSAKTAADLDRYVMWAAAEVGAEQDEAVTLTLDQALGQFFQRDRLFQESLEDKTEAGNTKSAKPAPASSPPPSTKVGGTAPQTQPRPGVSQ